METVPAGRGTKDRIYCSMPSGTPYGTSFRVPGRGPALGSDQVELVVLASQPEVHLGRVVCVPELLPVRGRRRRVVGRCDVETESLQPVPCRGRRAPIVVLQVVAEAGDAGLGPPVPDAVVSYDDRPGGYGHAPCLPLANDLSIQNTHAKIVQRDRPQGLSFFRAIVHEATSPTADETQRDPMRHFHRNF